MVSISNVAGNSAVLASLRETNRDIATNQTRIGTGRKINNYSDNAALYTTAQSIRSNIKAQDTLSANIGISKARADAASAGLDKLSGILTSINDLVLSTSATATAAEAAVNAGKIKNYVTQLTAISGASGFQGKSYIGTASVTDTVKLSNEASATIAFSSTDVAAGTALAALITAGAAVTDGASIAALAVPAALTEVSTLQGSVSAFAELLASQLDFQATLKGINETALSSIVDADLEEEAAKSNALQVKQQLAYQALSIGNSSAQNILRLFQ